MRLLKSARRVRRLLVLGMGNECGPHCGGFGAENCVVGYVRPDFEGDGMNPCVPVLCEQDPEY